MVVIIGAVIFWTFSLAPAQLTANVAVEIPNVVGQTYPDGSATLIAAKLVPEKLTEASETVPEGAIIRTDPAAGITVNPGLQVKVYVSLGQTPVAVPNVANMAEADAIAALVAKGLVYGSTTLDFSPDIRTGVVIRSDPEGGAERLADGTVIRQGATVNLVVSNGLVQVPDVTGKSIGEASSTLNSIGLNPTVVVDAGCSGGTVASQSIVGDQPQKSAISLRYCGG
jgi:serine/threonine-protein kinase